MSVAPSALKVASLIAAASQPEHAARVVAHLFVGDAGSAVGEMGAIEAEADGVLHIVVDKGSPVPVGQQIAGWVELRETRRGRLGHDGYRFRLPPSSFALRASANAVALRASPNTSLPMKSVHGGKADSATARTYLRK